MDYHANDKLLTAFQWSNSNDKFHQDWSRPTGLYCTYDRYDEGKISGDEITRLWASMVPTKIFKNLSLEGGILVKFVKFDREKYTAARYTRSGSRRRNNLVTRENYEVRKSSYEEFDRTEHFNFFTLANNDSKDESKDEPKEKFLQIQTVKSLYTAIEKSLAEKSVDKEKKYFQLFEAGSAYEITETKFGWKRDDCLQLINFFNDEEEIICKYSST